MKPGAQENRIGQFDLLNIEKIIGYLFEIKMETLR